MRSRAAVRVGMLVVVVVLTACGQEQTLHDVIKPGADGNVLSSPAEALFASAA